MIGDNEPSSKVDEGTRLDERGVEVYEIEVSFLTGIGAWDCLRRLKVPLHQRGEDWAAAFYGLPDDTEPNEMYLAAYVHSHPDAVHWGLQLLQMPASAPPETIVQSSELVGGYPGVLSALSRQFSEELRASIKDYQATATYWLPTERWESAIFTHTRTPSITHQQTKLTLTRETWQVEEPDGILNKASVIYDEDGFVLTVTGMPSMSDPQTMLESAEKSLWAALQPLLVGSKSTDDVEAE